MGLFTLLVGLSRLCSQTQCVVKINDQTLTLLLFLIFHTIYKICLCVEETTQYQLWHHIKHIQFCWFLSCRCHCFDSEYKMRRMLPLSNFLSIWFAFIGCVNCARWVLNFQLRESYSFSVKKTERIQNLRRINKWRKPCNPFFKIPNQAESILPVVLFEMIVLYTHVHF